MPNKIETGMRGQQAAEQYLLAAGCVLLARNFRAKTGEIDLIVRDGDYIAFVEVKYRSSLRYGHPREAVTAMKQRHIKRTAMVYIATHRLRQQDFRFDVVEVLENNGETTITHIPNAFW